MRKSWTRPASGWPTGRHARPAFLKSPTNSFFLVSTEITGWRAAWKGRTRARVWGAGRARGRDVAELRVPVGMRRSFACLLVGLQAVPRGSQQLGHQLVTDTVAHG